MHRRLLRKIRKGIGGHYKDIDPEDIFLDAANLPGFGENTFEGRIEKPVSARTFFFLRIILCILIIVLGGKLWNLGIMQGKVYAEISEKNRLEHRVIFANRGVILDRNGVELATNAIKEGGADFAGRLYTTPGLAHVVGYVKYPSKDAKGFYYDESYRGRDGVESYYDEVLAGKNGLELRETDVHGKITSESTIDKPEDGKPLILSLDGKLTEALHLIIKDTAETRGFTGGTGVIMDIDTGEILAMTSYPEYDQNILTSGADRQAISRLFSDTSKPFLNRAVSGLYTPGSIIKPIVLMAALNEGIISPSKKILSTGSITIPNPYDPSKPSIFRDWKEHGWTDMREALAVSSDVYFYSIGGGYGGQKGMGIDTIDRYFRLFGLSEKTGIDLFGETQGIIPNPEWKKTNFNGDIWRLGDTYITSIGQYGTQVTPMEAVRFTASLANGGKLLKPSVVLGGVPEEERVERNIELPAGDWQIVKEGMRLAVTNGTSVGLNMNNVQVAAKTGTAEIGAAKKYIHSWTVGFFPYGNPKYAYALIMERGPAQNPIGGTSVMRRLLDWMTINAPHYLQ